MAPQNTVVGRFVAGWEGCRVSNTPRLSHEKFFRKALLRLRNLHYSRGIHAVCSGFNQAFRDYYCSDSVEAAIP